MVSTETQPPREIERRFLVHELPEGLRQYERDEIEQGYLAFGSNSGHARLRRKGDALVLTVKQGEGLERAETEVELSKEQFDALWPLTAGRRLCKTRYRIPHGDLVIELDVFRTVVEGMTLAEVEFDTVEAAGAFTPPDWFGTEVTDDARYSNYSLATRAGERSGACDHPVPYRG